MIETMPKEINPKKFFITYFLDVPKHVLVLKLALFFILAFTSSKWMIHIPLRILALYMLIDHRFSVNKILWAILLAGHLLIIGLEWDFIDNHKYLSLYWVMTCYFSLFEESDEQKIKFLVLNSRLIIGLVFFFSTAWKFIGGQFINGTFMHFTFLTDSRFENFVGFITNITRDILPQNYDLLRKMKEYPTINRTGRLLSPLFTNHLALFVSWWTIFIEGSIALFFLLPTNKIISNLRHVSLMVFILTTYSFISVPGFNYLLVMLGLSQLNNNQRKWAITYIIVLIFSDAKKIPFFDYYHWLYNHLFVF